MPSTTLTDLKNVLYLKASKVPADVTTTAGGTAIDMQTTEGPCHGFLITGAVSGTLPTLDVKVQESDDGSTNWTDVSGASFTQVAAANKVYVISFNNRSKRYLRAYHTIGGSSTPTVTATVLLGAQLKFVGSPLGNVL